jgi:hypothetical protein
MMLAKIREGGRLLRRVDPASHWALKRFLIKLAAIAVFAGAMIQRPAAESILTLAYVNVLTSMVIGLLHRERCNSGPLNHWDEAAAFTALCALSHAAKFTFG